ncbi:lectin-like domain-containing protein [Ferruginibacter sp.]|nr:PKD domain-containing protein [Ferruginibacter sp.]
MKQILNTILFFLFCQGLLAQYTLNGNATQDACNAYSLTQAAGNQSGSVWNNNKIDLSQSFDFNFDVFLGSNDAGADGIVFVLQPISTSVGSTGGGLGYDGITPAVGVTIDTWQNGNDNDPAFDHIAIQLNGNLNHNVANNIAGPVTAINGNDNIEDGAWHSLRIQWDAATRTLSAYIDGSLRVSAVNDFVTNVFAGNPLVFWGFTGSTGGANNHQQFRTALNPSFSFGPTQNRCINEPITFISTTVSFTNIAKFYWDFGDGSPIDSVNLNPVHIYTTANDFIVKQRVIGADGCEATNTQTVRVGSIPFADFVVTFTNSNAACTGKPVTFTDVSSVTVGTINSWLWQFDDGTTATSQNTIKTYTTASSKTVNLTVKTIEGCESLLSSKTFIIAPSPNVDFTFTDSVCLGTPTFFYDNSTAPAGGTVNGWVWIFTDSIYPIRTQNSAHIFTNPGNQSVILLAVIDSNSACIEIRQKSVFVLSKPTAYFKTNTICQSAPTILTDSSYSQHGFSVNKWWWNLGNGNLSVLQNPGAIYNNLSNTVYLVVTDDKGCVSDTLKQPIVINPKPFANFGYTAPICYGLPVQFSDSSVVTGSVVNKWSWTLNNTEWSASQNANRSFVVFNPMVGLVATSVLGCASDTAFKTLFVSPLPDVTMSFNNSCKNAPVNFTAVDNSGTVTQWKWVFGDGAVATTQNAQHTYTANGTYKVKLFATASNGCYSDSLQKDIIIYGTNAFAGNDTIAAAGQPVQLKASGGLSYTWSPAASLNDPNIANPVTILTTTQTFSVKAFTPEGCESYDDVTVKIYNGPGIYLPNAFTPNGDTKNDVFKGIAVGIKQFNYLKVYNRWGQLVFYATDYNKGWDGMWKGQQQPGGVYIVLANGIDFKGNIIDKKSTVMLIR